MPRPTHAARHFVLAGFSRGADGVIYGIYRKGAAPFGCMDVAVKRLTTAPHCLKVGGAPHSARQQGTTSTSAGHPRGLKGCEATCLPSPLSPFYFRMPPFKTALAFKYPPPSTPRGVLREYIPLFRLRRHLSLSQASTKQKNITISVSPPPPYPTPPPMLPHAKERSCSKPNIRT